MSIIAAGQVDMSFWDQMTALISLNGIPTRQEYVNGLQNIDPVQCLLLLGLGAIYLLCGWKAFKALIIVNAGILGALGGAYVGGLVDGTNVRIIGAVAGGLLLAALAWPLMKYFVSMMGALAGAFLGYGVWNYVAGLYGSESVASHAWAGALIGLITLGLLAFVIFRETIIIFSSLQGSILAVSGGLAMLMKFNVFLEPLQRNIVNNIHLLPVLLAVPTVIGFAAQHTGAAKKAAKKKPKPALA